MAGDPVQPETSRLRVGLRRHGLAPRPSDLSHTLGRGGLRYTDGNAVDLYDCGRTAYPQMLEAIREAREFVHVETYILRKDGAGSRFLEALADRAAKGVDVRLLYDAVGSHRLTHRALHPLRTAGADVVVFNPLNRLYPQWAPRRRDHRKLLIVDGQVAFTGGLNIGDEYDAAAIGCDAGPGWRDTHVRVRGPAVRDLGAVFLESWFRAGGPDLPWHGLLDTDPGRPGSVRCAVLPDGPAYRRRAMRDLLVSALGGSRDTARLTSAYFAPDHGVLEAFERAAERGVQVELILAGRCDHPMLRRGARSTVERLLRRGVAVHEYTAGILHAKSAVFDARLAVVGTSNLDRQSFQHSYEVNLVVASPDVAAEVDGLFEADLAHSDEVTLETLARRGLATRFVDRLAARAVQDLV
jgi:cardiolipin synthase